MQQAIILIHTKRGKVDAVTQSLLQIEGVDAVYSTAGRYDVVALVRLPDSEEMHPVVNQQIASIKGIKKTHTLTAFRCYDREDLSRTFSVGLV